MDNKVLDISDDFVKNAIQRSINECDIHSKFIAEALDILSKYFPLTIKSYTQILKDNNMAYLDQFIYRYTKLEDQLGGSLISDVVYLFEYTENGKTFEQKLAILEKEGLVESVQSWQYFRSLRNRLSHEYTLDIDRQIQTLNEVCSAYFHLIGDFKKMKEFFEKLKA